MPEKKMQRSMTKIGIMQGRLIPALNNKIQSFPREYWDQEFALAEQVGLDCIEWIYDAYGEAVNPLRTDEGIARVRELSSSHNVSIDSLCADYFMEFPLVRANEDELARRVDKLEWLLERCKILGIQRVVLPFVDSSQMITANDQEQVLKVLHQILPIAETLAIELDLETNLDPQAFHKFLISLPHPLLKVNYDSGNSASLGFDPTEEFAVYGGRVGSVHIKDRKRDGGTVPLGTGDTNFLSVFTGLKKLGYSGDFILQVARGVPGNEVALAKQNQAFVERYWN